jgi:hypothetical protein
MEHSTRSLNFYHEKHPNGVATKRTPIDPFDIPTDHVLLPQTCTKSSIRVESKSNTTHATPLA